MSRWTYNAYRATLLRDGQRFAIVTPNGTDRLSDSDAAALLAELNAPKMPDPIAELPWKREREGKPGDRFDHNGCTVEVESRADGNVYYRASGKHGNHDCQNTIEEWHRLVAKAMNDGAKFTPAAE
jgi:hypothetical protein